MTSYAVIGVGGVGAFYGVHLARTGSSVHFLTRSATRAARREGVRLTSQDQVWKADATFHETVDTIGEVDTVLVATKATSNAEVANLVAQLQTSCVVLIQNGIDAEQVFAQRLPDSVEVVGGMAFLAAQRVAPAHTEHYGYGALTLGRYLPGYVAAEPTPLMLALVDDLARAEVPVVMAPDLLLARWQKLLWNIPFNGLTVLLGDRTDALVTDPASRRMVTDLMNEVRAAAAGDGRDLPADSIAGMVAATEAMTPYAPSMKVDYEHRRPLEVEQIYRAPLARAARNAVAMPRTELLADALTFLDARNRHTA